MGGGRRVGGEPNSCAEGRGRGVVALLRRWGCDEAGSSGVNSERQEPSSRATMRPA